MSSITTPLHAIAWLYIDGNFIHNGLDGYSYDRQMSRFIKLLGTLNFKQLCDVLCAKLNIDSKLYGLKIMHRCFNPVTKMYGVAPILDDDDVELMFELVTSLGVKNSVVELYLERVLVDGVVEKGVDVDVDVAVALNSSSEQTGVVCGEFGKRGEDLGVSTRLRKRRRNVKGRRGSGKRRGNVEGSGDLGQGGEIDQVSNDVESYGLNKKMFYMQRVDSQGKRVSRKEDKGGDGSIPLYSSFDGSYMVASLKEPLFTTIRDVNNVTDLEKGMVFVSRDELADIVSQVHHRNQQEIKVMRADSGHWNADCKKKASGCKWKLTAAKKRRHGFFEIMNISGSHTCVNSIITQEDANLNPTITPEDVNSQPTIIQEDANLICSNTEDANLNPAITPEDVNSQSTIIQEDADLICSNTKVPITQVVAPSV